jgi:hypothetical protein
MNDHRDVLRRCKDSSEYRELRTCVVIPKSDKVNAVSRVPRTGILLGKATESSCLPNCGYNETQITDLTTVFFSL